MAGAMDCEFSVEGDGSALILVRGIGAARTTWAKLLLVLVAQHVKRFIQAL